MVDLYYDNDYSNRQNLVEAMADREMWPLDKEELSLRKRAETLAKQLFIEKCPKLHKYDQKVSESGKEVVSSAMCRKNINYGPRYYCL